MILFLRNEKYRTTKWGHSWFLLTVIAGILSKNLLVSIKINVLTLELPMQPHSRLRFSSHGTILLLQAMHREQFQHPNVPLGINSREFLKLIQESVNLTPNDSPNDESLFMRISDPSRMLILSVSKLTH
jgi:hypothetical protein